MEDMVGRQCLEATSVRQVRLRGISFFCCQLKSILCIQHKKTTFAGLSPAPQRASPQNVDATALRGLQGKFEFPQRFRKPWQTLVGSDLAYIYFPVRRNFQNEITSTFEPHPIPDCDSMKSFHVGVTLLDQFRNTRLRS